MKTVATYAGACALFVGGVSLLLGALLGAGVGTALWVAGGIALVIQVPAFGALHRVWNDQNRMMRAWAGGILLRFATVGIVAFALATTWEGSKVALLVGLAGFLFGMLLIEPFFLVRAPRAEEYPGRRSSSAASSGGYASRSDGYAPPAERATK